MEQDEFTRRIEVYLEADMPHVANRRQIAELLAGRLYQYIRQPEESVPAHSATLDNLLPREALLVFTAAWDGSSQGHAETTREGVGASIAVIEVGIDDPVGSAIARMARVLITPAIARFSGSESSPPIIGRRSVAELREILALS